MLTALYYPHTQIKDEKLLRQALLLWDKVESITPKKNWKYADLPTKVQTEALEIISEAHYPNEAERKLAHGRVKSLIDKGLPDWFFLDRSKEHPVRDHYLIYPRKLADATWHLLHSENMARFDERSHDYAMSPSTGLMIMSLLADACAGTTKRKITDRTEAYSWLAKYATAEMGGEYVVGLDPTQVAPAYERLITISINLLNTDDIPISKLVAMRKREAKSSGADYRAFRLKYLGKVDEFVEKLRKPGVTKSDAKEIERQFQKDLAGDLSNLRTELGVARNKLVFSKETGIAVLATAGSFVEPIVGVAGASTALDTLGVGALVKAGVEYRAARRKALKESAMSWLYVSKSRIPWR